MAVETAFEVLFGSHAASSLTPALTTLLEESRGSDAAREDLGRKEIVQRLIQIVNDSLDDAELELTTLALRCLGNACINNDVARNHVNDKPYLWAVRCLSAESGTPSISLIAAKVLYNICTDFEPAQQQCCRQSVDFALLDLCNQLAGEASDDRTLVTDLLFLIFGQRTNIAKSTDAGTAVPDASATALVKLLQLPARYDCERDVDDMASVVECVLVLLRETATQEQLIAERMVSGVWDILDVVQRIIDSHVDQEDVETRKLLIGHATSVTWCLSDIAAKPTFAAQYQLDDVWINNLLELLRDLGDSMPSDLRKQTAACQVIGNLLWTLAPSMEPSHAEKSMQGISQPIFHAIVETTDAEFLHAAAGLLIQLTRSSVRAREVVGCDRDAGQALSKLCNHTNPGVKQDGVRLLQALGKESPSNQGRFDELARQVTAASHSDAV